MAANTETGASPGHQDSPLTGDHVVVATDLYKAYGDLVAVGGLSLELKRGEIFGLLGPNGAGKTTMISMLVGLLRPDSGSVMVEYQPGQQGDPLLPIVRRAIGIAPQSLSLYDELTARENLEFFGKLYGLAGKHLKQRVDWSLEFSGLADRQRDRVGTFSGGMSRRLNIAVALIHEPAMLLLDEPTVGVDPQSRNHIFESIEQLKEDGLTILYTTHYMEEARRLCDRVAIVDHGKLLAMDTVDGLIEQYGGRSVVECELKSCPDDVQLPGRRDGDAIRFESETPLEKVAELTRQGVEFQSLRIAQPDLESVFLSLTGRSLRD